MEDGLVQSRTTHQRSGKKSVLILVVMEDGLVPVFDGGATLNEGDVS